jgi:integrase/recombinase XerC
VGDVVSLLHHAAQAGHTSPGDLEIAVLRGWLAARMRDGAARTSQARRAAAARNFTAWAHRAGLAAHDAGTQLASPRAHRDLPTVLRADQAAALMAVEDTRDRASWNCSTPPASGSASSAASTEPTSTRAGG